jgi:hypothetical protein
MNFLIADTFTASFNRLPGLDQKAVKASVFDLQMDPVGTGLQLHRIDKSKDPHFWSARVNRDIRLIVHKTGDSVLVAYVDHHDAAYAWAERRRIEAHPRTGAIQIVEVRERVEEVARPAALDPVVAAPAAPTALFAALDDNALLSIGVPPDWLADVRAASEDGFFALAAPQADGLFLAGDVGQRIFQHPFSWASLGVEVRGRSFTLKVCYRTSQQIRRAADRLLPVVLRDTDGLEDERRGIISVFDGPSPEVKAHATVAAEADTVRRVVETWLREGIAAHEIGLFVRTPQLVARAQASVAGLAGASEMTTAPMSLAKGLEFRAVVVMACDEGILPLDERVADAADEAELDDIYETERRLLYVACTRAREHLLLTGVAPASEYLADFASQLGGGTGG